MIFGLLKTAEIHKSDDGSELPEYSAWNTVHYQTHKYKGPVRNQASDNKDGTQKLPTACKEVFWV